MTIEVVLAIVGALGLRELIAYLVQVYANRNKTSAEVAQQQAETKQLLSQAQIDAYERQIQTLTEAYQVQLAALKSSGEAQVAQLDEIRVRWEKEYQHLADQYKCDVARVAEENIALESHNRKLIADNEKARAVIDELNAQKRNVEREAGQYRKQLADLVKKVDQQEKTISSQQETIDGQQAELAQMRQDMRKLQSALEVAQRTQALSQQRIEQLETIIQQKERELAVARNGG